MIYTHTSGFITLTSSYCYPMLTGMLCLSTSMDCFQAILSLMYIHPQKKTNMAIVKNQPVEDVSPIKQWWFVMICPYSTLVLLQRTTSHRATFPLRLPNGSFRARDTDKLAKSKAPKSSTSKCSEGDGFLVDIPAICGDFFRVWNPCISKVTNQEMGQICQCLKLSMFVDFWLFPCALQSLLQVLFGVVG